MGVVERAENGDSSPASDSSWAEAWFFHKLRWFIWLSLFRSLLFFCSLFSQQDEDEEEGGGRRRRTRWGAVYDEPSLRSWQQLSQPLVLRRVQLITRLCQCHGVTAPPRLNALPALSDKSHQTSLTDTPPFPPLSVIAVFLSSRRCSIPRSLNQLALTRRKAVPVKTVKGEDDI